MPEIRACRCMATQGKKMEPFLVPCLRGESNPYSLKLQALGKLIFYRHIAHVTPKKLKSCVFKRSGTDSPLTFNLRFFSHSGTSQPPRGRPPLACAWRSRLGGGPGGGPGRAAAAMGAVLGGGSTGAKPRIARQKKRSTKIPKTRGE